MALGRAVGRVIYWGRVTRRIDARPLAGFGLSYGYYFGGAP